MTLLSMKSGTDLIDVEGLRKSVTKEFHTVQKEKLSKAGEKGAKTKHAGTNALKKWAKENAKTMLGSDKQIAEKLFSRLPDHLKNVSKDPERLIYDALRAPEER